MSQHPIGRLQQFTRLEAEDRRVLGELAAQRVRQRDVHPHSGVH